MPQTITFSASDIEPSPATPAPITFTADQIERQPDFKVKIEADPNTVGTLTSHFVSQVNPVPIGQVVPFPKALGGGGWDAPIEAGKHMLAAQGEVGQRMVDAYKQGDLKGAAIHALHWLLPVIGPVLDKAGEEYKQGKYAAGTGDTLGLSTVLFGPQAVAEVKAGIASSKTGQAVAKAAEEGATRRGVEVMAPTVGPNKVRLGNQIAKVAPDVLRQTTAVTRGGLLDQAWTKLEDANTVLDAAYDAVPATRMYPTGPIRAKLTQAIKDLSISGNTGSVEPATRASRIGALKQAITELDQLGTSANLKNLRTLSQSWGEGAKAVYTPAVAADYLNVRSAGSGWADARSAVSDFLTTQHPELKPLNANATLWIRATDVMQAAEEADRVRPKVGRSIMARGLGAAAGGELSGGWGAITGAVIAPTIERTISAMGPATKTMVARRMLDLSDALRAGRTTQARSILEMFRRALPREAGIQAGQSVVAGSMLPAVAGTPTSQTQPK